jgi:hypothetical protein
MLWTTNCKLKSSIFWDITPCSLLKVKRRLGGIYRFHLQGRRISQARNQCESKWQVETGGKMEDSKSLPAGSPIGQNEPPIPIGSETQTRKPSPRGEPTGNDYLPFTSCCLYNPKFRNMIALIVTRFPLD